MCQAGQREKLYVLLLHRGPHVDSQPQVVTRQPADSVRREREKSVSQNRFCDVPSFPNIIERQKHRLESLYNQVFDSTTVHHGFPHFAQSCWFKNRSVRVVLEQRLLISEAINDGDAMIC